jgi:UDPglucose 6-dehydrogenase
VGAWQELLAQRGEWVLRELTNRLDAQPEIQTIAVWGLAYKENTHSTRNSASLHLLAALPHLAKRVYDPQVKLTRAPFPNFIACPDWESACEGAEVLLIMTPWSEFRQVSVDQLCSRFKGRLVLDPYGVLDGGEIRRRGLDYARLGVT